MSSPSQHFSDTIAGITTMLAARHDGLSILRVVTDAYATVLAADATGVLVADPRGGLAVLSSSDERARFVELLQAHLQDGPCLECIVTNAMVPVTDLSDTAGRWSRFVAASTEQGFHAVYAFPLRLIDHAVGGINVFYTRPTTLSDRQLRVGQALADLAVLGMTQERDQRRAERLAESTLTTLNDRVQVSQAVGVLAATSGTDPDIARGLLADYSARTGRPIREIAQGLTDGTLSAHTVSGSTK